MMRTRAWLYCALAAGVAALAADSCEGNRPFLTDADNFPAQRSQAVSCCTIDRHQSRNTPAAEANGCEFRQGQATLFRLRRFDRPRVGGGPESLPPSRELFATNGHMTPVFGGGVGLLNLVHQVREIVQRCNRRAGSVVDERDIFPCHPEIHRALDVLQGDAAAAPF